MNHSQENSYTRSTSIAIVLVHDKPLKRRIDLYGMSHRFSFNAFTVAAILMGLFNIRPLCHATHGCNHDSFVSTTGSTGFGRRYQA